jgi:uncharacterized protein YaaR (DUF327 family)
MNGQTLIDRLEYAKTIQSLNQFENFVQEYLKVRVNHQLKFT